MSAEPDPPPDRPPPPLDWSQPEAPRSRLYGDVYYSLEDGLAESRAVFLAGCGLPDAWAGRARFTVAELGFGTGLNIVALIHMWRQAAPPGARLHVLSVEAHPLARADAARALAAWPEIAETAAALLDAWPGGDHPAPPGFHRIDLPWNVTLDLAVGDAAWALDQWGGAADAWFLDGFSPALNPAMWSDAVLDAIAARSAPDARLATFTVAGAVRRGLAQRGFAVDKRPGHGRKRERLEARLGGARPDVSAPPHVAVIGAGIAGASACRALAAAGCAVSVVEAEGPGAGASGFPAALVTPRLDAGDEDLAALFAQMLARAGALYDAVPHAVIAQGVMRRIHGPRDPARFDRVAAQPIWPAGAMSREPGPDGGLWMASALTLRPAAVLERWLTPANRVRAAVADLRADGAGLRVMDAEGETILSADAVVLTAGWGAAALAPHAGLAPVRGQADWVAHLETPAPPAHGVAWGGYAAPTGGGVLWGATHDRDDTGREPTSRDRLRNLETLRQIFPDLASAVADGAVNSRAALRAVTRDRLPIAGRIAPNLYVLGGLGSRGFTAAPLLGEHLAAMIAGAPSPLPRGLAARVDPARGALSRNRTGG